MCPERQCVLNCVQSTLALRQALDKADGKLCGNDSTIGSSRSLQMMHVKICWAGFSVQAYEAVDALSQELASVQAERDTLKQLHEDGQGALDALAAEVEELDSAKQEVTDQLAHTQQQLEEANKQVGKSGWILNGKT